MTVHAVPPWMDWLAVAAGGALAIPAAATTVLGPRWAILLPLALLAAGLVAARRRPDLLPPRSMRNVLGGFVVVFLVFEAWVLMVEFGGGTH